MTGTHWKSLKVEDAPFDILLLLHNSWNQKEVMTHLNEQVPTFTIIRDSVEVFVSMFHSLVGFREFYGVADIHDMVRMIRYTPHLRILCKRWMEVSRPNQMAWEMGLSTDIFDNQTVIKNKIERLDREFELVMLASRMEESLESSLKSHTVLN